MKHAALLRGINVGGRNLVPMKDLAHEFAAAGCADVKTYIQSGNVVFAAPPSAVGRLATVLQARIAKRFGIAVPVILRSSAELAQAIAGNPFLATGAPVECLHVYFLAGQPAADRVCTLDANRCPPDAFYVSGREIYLLTPNGMARTKLTNAYFDSKLKTVSTARNWATVLKLYEMTIA